MENLQPLNSEQLSVVNWVEQYWHNRGEFPNTAQLKKRFGEELDVKSLLEHETFKFAMLKRGVKMPDSHYLPDEISKEQVAAALKFLDFEDKRSLATKLKEVGVTTGQWYGWMKDPVFKDFILSNSTKDFEDGVHIAQQGLLRALERGETNAIKFYYELTGRHKDSQGTIDNIKVVIAQLIEVIQRRVKDTETLALISNDFELILGGKPVALDTPSPGTDLSRVL